MPAGKVRINWHGNIVAASLSKSLSARLAVVGTMLSAQIKVNISIPVVKAAGPSGRLRVIERSKPGEYPRLETGNLRRGIFHKMASPTEVHVGTVHDYGLYLELGTRFMEPRPYLERTLLNHVPDIERILLAPITLQGGP